MFSYHCCDFTYPFLVLVCKHFSCLYSFQGGWLSPSLLCVKRVPCNIAKFYKLDIESALKKQLDLDPHWEEQLGRGLQVWNVFLTGRLWVECIIVRPCSQAIVALTFSVYATKPLFPDCDPPDSAVRLLAAICICKYNMPNQTIIFIFFSYNSLNKLFIAFF